LLLAFVSDHVQAFWWHPVVLLALLYQKTVEYIIQSYGYGF